MDFTLKVHLHAPWTLDYLLQSMEDEQKRWALLEPNYIISRCPALAKGKYED
jgi:hypothetical protein